MGLLRALSTTKGRRGGYDRLLDETNSKGAKTGDHNKGGDAVLKRVASVPARMLFGSSSRKIKTSASSSYSSSSSPSWSERPSIPSNNKPKTQDEKPKGGKVHPVFGLFDGRSWSKRKFTSNPEFSRYVDYLQEGGALKTAQHAR